jgi:hypothetical protein
MFKKIKTKDINFENIIIENQDDKVDIKFPVKYVINNNPEEFMFQTPKLIFEELEEHDNNTFLIASLKNTQASVVFVNKIWDIENKMLEKISTLSKTYGPVKINESCLANKPKLKFKIKKHYGKPQITVENKERTLVTLYDLYKNNEIICNVSVSALWFYNSWGYYLNVEEILVL